MAGALKLGMVGGGQGAFIGAVHRMAARLDGHWEIVAGALASTPERALASGEELGLAPDRIYSDFATMAQAEAAREAQSAEDAAAAERSREAVELTVCAPSSRAPHGARSSAAPCPVFWPRPLRPT